MPNREWDLTSTSSLQGSAEWLRKKSGALLVVVIRVDDLAIAADPACAPRESENLLLDRAPELHARLEELRREALAKLDRDRDREQRKAAR